MTNTISDEEEEDIANLAEYLHNRGLGTERSVARSAHVALMTAQARIDAAKTALIRDGYFSDDQIGEDIAPRIVERLSKAMLVDKAMCGDYPAPCNHDPAHSVADIEEFSAIKAMMEANGQDMTKPEARQWREGSFRERRENPNIWRATEIVAWVKRNGGEARYEPCTSVQPGKYPSPRIALRRADGWTYAKPGDWIVMGDTFIVKRTALSDYACRDFFPSKTDPSKD